MTVVAEPLTTAIRIPIAGRIWLHGDIYTPPGAKGLVLFAHGSGGRRYSPRNRYVAFGLDARHMATVIADLLTDDEEKLDERTGALRFDVGILTQRLVQVTDWVRNCDLIGTLPLGLFGASTGAAAALDAAALRPEAVRAVVCSGGRPDLALRLGTVKAATLIIVGGNDSAVLELNAMASSMMTCAHEIEVIPGANHLFDEPGALEAVTSATAAWFHRYLTRTGERVT